MAEVRSGPTEAPRIRKAQDFTVNFKGAKVALVAVAFVAVTGLVCAAKRGARSNSQSTLGQCPTMGSDCPDNKAVRLVLQAAKLCPMMPLEENCLLLRQAWVPLGGRSVAGEQRREADWQRVKDAVRA